MQVGSPPVLNCVFCHRSGLMSWNGMMPLLLHSAFCAGTTYGGNPRRRRRRRLRQRFSVEAKLHKLRERKITSSSLSAGAEPCFEISCAGYVNEKTLQPSHGSSRENGLAPQLTGNMVRKQLVQEQLPDTVCCVNSILLAEICCR